MALGLSRILILEPAIIVNEIIKVLTTYRMGLYKIMEKKPLGSAYSNFILNSTNTDFHVKWPYYKPHNI